VGPSGVAKVDIWVTQDGGRSWRFLCQDSERRGLAEVDLPGEGTYGLALEPTNGQGLSALRPSPGSLPDCWIEVDTTGPVAQLLDARTVNADEGGTLLINWTAQDKNLGPEPIALYYACQRQGPWQPIAKNVANHGSYRWRIPQELGAELYLRMDVTDRAGNLTQCKTAQAITMDLTRPKATVIRVSAAQPKTSPWDR